MNTNHNTTSNIEVPWWLVVLLIGGPAFVLYLFQVFAANLWLQVVVLVVASLLSMWKGLVRLNTRTSFQIVAAGALLWFSLTTFFAALYAAVYALSPLSFRYASDMLDPSLNTSLAQGRETLRQIRQRLYFSELMLAAADSIVNSSKTRQARQQGDVEVWESKTSLSKRFHLEMESVTRVKKVGPEFQIAQDRSICVTETAKNYCVWRIGSATAPAIVPGDAESGLARILLLPDDAATLRSRLTAYMKSLSEKREAEQTQIERLLNDRGSMDLSHFIYFSVTITTTIGNADVTPNSTTTRYLVSLQSFLVVVFFGLLLNYFFSLVKPPTG